MCSNPVMRWDARTRGAEDHGALPGLGRVDGLVRSVSTPEFAGVTFHKVLARTALNHVPGPSSMPFNWTVNPYRGCTHACTYCLQGDTQVLMASGRQKSLRDVRVGDVVLGTERRGTHRRYTPTRVLAHWPTTKPAYRVRLADGTELVASADHRFLTERGWKHVARTDAEQRPHLTTRNHLLGIGDLGEGPKNGSSYRRGYLTGVIRGANLIGRGTRLRAGRRSGWAHRLRLALVDDESLDRARTFLEEAGVATTAPSGSHSPGYHALHAKRTSWEADVRVIRELVAWPEEPDTEWSCGYLAGIFDAQGSFGKGTLRISSTDERATEQVVSALGRLGLASRVEMLPRSGQRPVAVTRLVGGVPAAMRFMQRADPATRSKRSIAGQAVRRGTDMRVVAVEPLGLDLPLFDITTGTGDFIANGVISHNCYARGSHSWLELDTGTGFDSEIVVKTNVVEVLGRELARPGWNRETVALGTNTDPYQRAEGRYRLMPGIIRALAMSGTPVSLLTKGTLLRRDLPLLVAAAGDVPVGVGVSIAVGNHALHESLEPGAPSPRARLDLVRAVREAGLPCGVFLAPVMPGLTDSLNHLDGALASIAATGATGVVVVPLHLRTGAREWFMSWLARERPDLLPRYERMYAKSAYVSADYAQWLRRRVRPLLERHGLTRDPTTRTPGTADAGRPPSTSPPSGSASVDVGGRSSAEQLSLL